MTVTETDAEDGSIDAALRGLPPSTKFVAHVLADRGTSTHATLVDATDLPSRTVYRALNRLDDRGLLDTEPVPDDPRRRRYSLADDD